MSIDSLTTSSSSVSCEQFAQLPLVSTSYRPYTIVRHLTSTTKTFGECVKSVQTTLFNESTSDIDAETSCIKTVYTLAVLFSGVEKAKVIADRLRYKTSVELYVNITKEKAWSYKVEDLFTGPLLLQLKEGLPGQNNCDQERQKKIADCMQNIVIPFFEHLNPIIETAKSVAGGDTDENAIIQALEKTLSRVEYNFNVGIISSLKARICINKRKVNDFSTSVVYYIAIVKPVEEAVERTLFYHSFVIEQYYSPAKKATYHRLYQSCQNEMTLNDYFQMKNYDDEDEGCLTYSQIITFLDAVAQILSRNQEPSELLRLSQECFGTQSFRESPVTFFDTHTKSLAGMSLRYEESIINPAECKNHLCVLSPQEQV